VSETHAETAARLVRELEELREPPMIRARILRESDTVDAEDVGALTSALRYELRAAPYRERLVRAAAMRFTGMTLRAVGEAIGLSTERTRQLLNDEDAGMASWSRPDLLGLDVMRSGPTRASGGRS